MAAMPVTLTVGDPAVAQVDMKVVASALVEFIADNPVLSLGITAGLILAIYACNQPPQRNSWA